VSQPVPVSPVIRSVAERVFLRLMPPRRRNYIEFAESEFILPNGPRKGLPYRVDFMPFARELLTEYTRGRYTEFYLSGPAQSSKTLHGYLLPSMYHLFEIGEDVILGAPVVEMAQDAYLARLLPAIESSRYRDLLPRQGGGSKGGKSLSIRFGNGASIRFMGAGGGDQQRSSYTARVVVCTELDKMDEAGAVSREADPVSQLKARTASFGAAARFYGECTMSTKKGRIYREVCVLGSDSRVFLPCARCGEWIFPEREGLVGWQAAQDVLQAKEQVRFQCPKCQGLWTEEERRQAMLNPRIVSKDQEVTRTGEVVGPEPKTETYGFRWNCMASPLVTMADIAKDEWNAEQTGSQADQKALAQFRWAVPYEEEILDLTNPDVETILRKVVGHARGAIPSDTFKVTLALDVGSYVIWWSLWAWKPDAQGHLVDLGSIDVPLVGGVKSKMAVLAALRTFRENVIKAGWGGRHPDRILVDSGYETDVVYDFVAESGQPRYLACKGYGTSSRHGSWTYNAAVDPTPQRIVMPEYKAILQPGGIKLIHAHADHWKATVHDGFWAAQGAPGALTIFKAPPNDKVLRQYARHVVAEQRESRSTGEREAKVVWVVKQRQNHHLDTSWMARCAAEIEGVRLVPRAKKPPAPPPAPPPEQTGLSRNKY
jgi:phage terminase large subunit GpA-like protein